MFERGDTFGEHVFVPRVSAGHDAPPVGRPFPSRLRALTDVVTMSLDKYAYDRALAKEPKLEDWIRAQVVLSEQLANLVSALRCHSDLNGAPGFRKAEMAKRGRAVFLKKGERPAPPLRGQDV